MKVLIPAAGRGSRLGKNIKKQLVTIGEHPALYYVLGQLNGVKNISEIIFVIPPDGDDIISTAKSILPRKKISYCVQDNPKGPAHAAWCAFNDILCDSLKDGENLFILLSDVLVDYNFAKFNYTTQFLVVSRVDKDVHGGRVVLDDKYQVTQLSEVNLISDFVWAGVANITSVIPFYSAINYILAKKIKENDEFQLTTVFTRMIQNGHNFSAVTVKKYYDFGTWDSIHKFEEEMLG